MKKNILTYTLVAVLAALSVGLNFLKIPLAPSVRITLYALPLLFAGCCFDFKASLLTGALTGVVLQLISEYGITVTSPFWALAPIGWSVTAFLINKLLIKLHLAFRVIVIVIIASVVATGLNTLAMLAECWLIQDAYYTYAKIATELPTRLLLMLVMILPYSLLLYVLVNRVGPLYKKQFEESEIQADSSNEEK